MKKIKELWIKLEHDLFSLNASNSVGILKRYLLSRMGLYLGYDISDKKRIIILSIDKIDLIADSDFPTWEGVLIEKRKISENKDGIIIKLIDEDSLDIFNSLIKDIYYTLNQAEDSFDVIDFFMNTLYKWNEFFKKYGVRILSEEKQRGLYGELHFLLYHVFDLLSLKQSIESWCGDEPRHQDFSFINGNVEVKATIKKEHKKVSISSEKQLDNTGLKYLYLYCITLNQDSNNGQSLSDIINNIREILNGKFGLLYKFNDYLNNLGYLDEHEKYYSKNKYIFKREYLFNIKQGFPRIVNPPEGVGDIKYSITISSCLDYNLEIKDSLKRLIK